MREKESDSGGSVVNVSPEMSPLLRVSSAFVYLPSAGPIFPNRPLADQLADALCGSQKSLGTLHDSPAPQSCRSYASANCCRLRERDATPSDPSDGAGTQIDCARQLASAATEPGAFLPTRLC